MNVVSRRQVMVLDFAREHAQSYNELVEVVKRNLLLADWSESLSSQTSNSGNRDFFPEISKEFRPRFDDEHHESLLSLRNARWGAEMADNLR